MKKARVLPLAAGMLSVAMALTACGSPAASASSASSGTAESAASASEASQDEPVTITYCNFNASGGNEETLAKMYEAFHAEYVTPAGRMMSDAQTAYALAIVFDIVGDDARQAMGDRLAPPGCTRSRWAPRRSGSAGTRCCPTAPSTPAR